MPQDAFTLRLVARELDGALRGGKINRVNQPAREELSLLIYTGKRTVKLLLNANASDCGAYFCEEERENPLVAPNFCMLLRKHLTGAEVLSVSTAGFERILVFRLACVSDFTRTERELRCEIMGKYSNILLLENGVILGALKTTSLDENRKRAILPGAKYLPPAPQDKTDPSDRAALRALLCSPPAGDLARFLFLNVAGLAPVTAEQIASSYRGGDLAEHVYTFLFSDELSPCVIERGGKLCDFSARGGGIPYPTLLEAETAYYTARRAKKELEGERRRLQGAVSAARKKQEKRLQQTLEGLRECGEAEESRIKGELLTANLYALRKGMKSCELINYYDENGGTVKIALDETLSPAQNAQRYFKRYRKLKRASEFLTPQAEECRAEIAYLGSLTAAIAVAESREDVLSLEEELLAAGLLKSAPTRKKRDVGTFRTFEREGFTIRAGRNNLQNERLVRSSKPDDIWLHTQKYHSAHVVIETNGRAVPDEVLLFAASVCVRYSDGKGGGRIPVDYCRVKFVKKPPRSKAGFVVYTDYKTILSE